MAEKYANINKTIMLGAFYSAIFPFGLFLEIIGLLIFYWVSKFIFIRRSALPNALSDALTGSMIRIALVLPLVRKI